jgi:DNA (cytosine-5)-methyltransferase 1
MRPRLLDLFSGAGGAAMGYSRAGFDVTGVDNRPQKRYPFVFILGDALEYCREHGAEYDVIHASPPCQRYTVAQNAAKNALAHPDLVGVTRDALRETGTPWVIENVVGAPLRNPVMLCGLSFGLKVRRHRLFESNIALLNLPCACTPDAEYFVIFGHEVRNRRHGDKAGRTNCIAAGRKAMGIPWMTCDELSQAIPPAYTEYIGLQLLEAIR